MRRLFHGIGRIVERAQLETLGIYEQPEPVSETDEPVLLRSSVDPSIVIGDGQSVTAWARHRIEELTGQLRDRDATIARLERQLKDATPGRSDPGHEQVRKARGIGLPGTLPLAHCDADRHLLRAIDADRRRLEAANDRLRAINGYLVDQLRETGAT